jgi:hypothetical protein
MNHDSGSTAVGGSAANGSVVGGGFPTTPDLAGNTKKVETIALSVPFFVTMLLCFLLGTFYANSHGTNQREWREYAGLSYVVMMTGLPYVATMFLCLLLGTFYANSRGTFKFVNGDVYVGDWKDGKHYGQGTFKNADGDVYVGEWKNGKRHGLGTLKWADGDVYVGDWEDGEFVNGSILHGLSIYRRADGNVYFMGEWK